MVKYFCDICGKDITNYKTSRVMGEKGRLKVEVMVSIDGVWNGGHACEDCIKDACANATIQKKAIVPDAQEETKP